IYFRLESEFSADPASSFGAKRRTVGKGSRCWNSRTPLCAACAQPFVPKGSRSVAETAIHAATRTDRTNTAVAKAKAHQLLDVRLFGIPENGDRTEISRSGDSGQGVARDRRRDFDSDRTIPRLRGSGNVTCSGVSGPSVGRLPIPFKRCSRG